LAVQTLKIGPLEWPVHFFSDIAFRETAIPARQELEIYAPEAG
jgi:hypothetical protein